MNDCGKIKINKKPAFWADSLTRRPVGSNHILFDRTVRLSGDDQIRLISASSNLRNDNYISDGTKNNTSIFEDVVSGPVDWDTASPDNYLHYSKVKNGVNSRYERNYELRIRNYGFSN